MSMKSKTSLHRSGLARFNLGPQHLLRLHNRAKRNHLFPGKPLPPKTMAGTLYGTRQAKRTTSIIVSRAQHNGKIHGFPIPQPLWQQRWLARAPDLTTQQPSHHLAPQSARTVDTIHLSMDLTIQLPPTPWKQLVKKKRRLPLLLPPLALYRAQCPRARWPQNTALREHSIGSQASGRRRTSTQRITMTKARADGK